MKRKELARYAILFKHPTGWTYVNSHASAAGAQVYITNRRSIYDKYQWKIVPCKLILQLPDVVAKNFQ